MSKIDQYKKFSWENVFQEIKNITVNHEHIPDLLTDIQIHVYEVKRDNGIIPDEDIVNICKILLSPSMPEVHKNRLSNILHDFAIVAMATDEDMMHAAHSLEIRAPVGSYVRNIANEDAALALIEIIMEIEKNEERMISDSETISIGKEIFSRPNRFEELLKDYPIIVNEQ